MAVSRQSKNHFSVVVLPAPKDSKIMASVAEETIAATVSLLTPGYNFKTAIALFNRDDAVGRGPKKLL